MVKQIVRDIFFLGQPSEPATKAEKLSYAKTKKIQSEQNKIYDKFIFFKSLYKELERNDKNEWN